MNFECLPMSSFEVDMKAEIFLFSCNLPINGRHSEFGGILSATSIKKTVIERSVVTPIETFSPWKTEIRRKFCSEKQNLTAVRRNTETEKSDDRY